MFKNFAEVIQKVKEFPKIKIAVAAAEDDAVLEALKDIVEQNLADPILVGNKAKIADLAEKLSMKLAHIEIIDEIEPAKAAQKAVALVSSKKADVLMKGLVNSSDFMKAVLNNEYGLRTGNIISHLAVLEMPNFSRLLYLTDGGINILPSLDEKIGITKNSVEFVRKINQEEPNVALMAANEQVSPKMPATIDANDIAQRLQQEGYLIDGPLALDLALSEEAAYHKGFSSPVAGKADILIVPNIESGNMLGKGITYLAGGIMAGVVLGAKAPIVMTSRADTALAKFYSIVLACLGARD